MNLTPKRAAALILNTALIDGKVADAVITPEAKTWLAQQGYKVTPLREQQMKEQIGKMTESLVKRLGTVIAGGLE